MFDVIYQDDYLVVVHKPAGMLVHKSELDVHEQRVVLQRLGEQLGLHLYPVHRLDKATSGLLMFALSADMARAIQAQFANHRIRKSYTAVVRGFLQGAGEVDHALSEKRDQRRAGVGVSEKDWPGKPAQTTFQGLLTCEIPIACGRYPNSRYSLVRLFPKTGRRHQLRRHMKHISHPIIGDTTYGQGLHNRLFREHFQSQRLLLCATALQLPHPKTSALLELSTDLDEDFLRVTDQLGWPRSAIKSLD